MRFRRKKTRTLTKVGSTYFDHLEGAVGYTFNVARTPERRAATQRGSGPISGYFWLPCPVCGQMFSGSEGEFRGDLISDVPDIAWYKDGLLISSQSKTICLDCAWEGRGRRVPNREEDVAAAGGTMPTIMPMGNGHFRMQFVAKNDAKESNDHA